MTQNSTFGGWRLKEFSKDSSVGAISRDFFLLEAV